VSVIVIVAALVNGNDAVDVIDAVDSGASPPLDHSPALALLGDDHGVAGAAGIQRQTGERWQVKASAVVIATGGCAF